MLNLSQNDSLKLQGMITEASNAMIRISAEQDFIKDVLARAKDELSLPPKLVRAMIKIYHKNALQEMKMESDSLFSIYEQVMSVQKPGRQQSTVMEDEDDEEDIV